jgi:hypothetical protein
MVDSPFDCFPVGGVGFAAIDAVNPVLDFTPGDRNEWRPAPYLKGSVVVTFGVTEALFASKVTDW